MLTYLEDIICLGIQSLNRLTNGPLVSVIGTETVVSGNPGVRAEGAGGKHVHFASPDAGILLAPSRKERVQLKVERTSLDFGKIFNAVKVNYCSCHHDLKLTSMCRT